MMNGRMTTAAINERDETDTVDDDDLAGRRVTPITHHLQKRGRFVGNKHFGYFLLLFFSGFPCYILFFSPLFILIVLGLLGFVWEIAGSGEVMSNSTSSHLFWLAALTTTTYSPDQAGQDAVPLLAAVLITLIESFRLLFLFLGWGSALRDVC